MSYTSALEQYAVLGVVRHACSATLNGHLLGRKLWAPFVFELPADCLAENNLVEIRISNTLSNLFTSAAYLDRIDELYSPDGARYVRILEAWERETCASGLLGPVRLAGSSTPPSKGL